jgi:hypothetical protein
MVKNTPSKRKAKRGTPEYRSDLERRVAKQLRDAEISYIYEGAVLPYAKDGKVRSYTPDFMVGPNIFIETKGWFVGGERDSQKLLLVQQQHPEIDLRLLFQREKHKMPGKEETTYAEWAEAHGFSWAGGGTVPETWIQEFHGTLH